MGPFGYFPTCSMTTPVAAKPAGSKPVVKVQLGNISVAVFAREVSKPDGTIFTAKDYVLQRSWRDRQSGQWQDQSLSLRRGDILAVQQALAKAFVDSYDKLDADEE